MTIPVIPDWVFAAGMLAAVLVFLYASGAFGAARNVLANVWAKLSVPPAPAPVPYVPEQPPEDEEIDWDQTVFSAWRIIIEDVSDPDDPVDPDHRKKVLAASVGFLNRRASLEATDD